MISLNHNMIRCPKCHSERVNTTGDVVASHSPEGHNWYGQQHIFYIPMMCQCGLEFRFEVSSYKERAEALAKFGDEE